MQLNKIFDSNDNEAVYFEGTTPFVVFLFLPRAAQPLHKNGNIGFFRKRGVHFVTLRSKTNRWWIDDDFRSCVDAVAHFVDQKNFDRRIGYGISMGTFGAFYHRQQFRLDELLLYSPIVTLDPVLETRWIDDYSTIPVPDDALYLRNGAIDLGSMPTTLIYDPRNRDAQHVKLLRGQNITHIQVPGGGHAVANWLKDRQLLSLFGDAFLFGTKTPSQLRRLVQRHEPGRLSLILRKNSSRRPRQSAKVLVKLAESAPQFLPDLAICWSRMKQHTAAAEALNNFAGRDSEAYSNSDFIMALTVYLRQGGNQNLISGHVERILRQKIEDMQVGLWVSNLLRFLRKFDDAFNTLSVFDSSAPAVAKALAEIEQKKRF